ncbi:MAG: glycosyltransferase [Gammaproteobacteria bacterium]|nr:glycosyltransferase [Gammaproteobacteria bacterium]
MSLRALSVGRLAPVKDFPLLLTAWVHVNIPLQIAGEGPEKDDLIGLQKALRLEDRVEFLGHRSDVDTLYTNADLVVVPSRREGFGYVTLEALQHRCVVIATHTGIAEELIPDQYLVQSSPQELANTVNWTINNLSTARTDFGPVWDYANTLTVEKMTDATLAVYDLLLAP